jgi:xanthine dehydrogenase YagS FAD-binding subunit
VALAALDALVLIDGPAGSRRIALDRLYRPPGDDPTRDTTLAHGELISAVELPPPSALSRQSGYRKARDRASFAFAVGAVAAAVTVDHGAVREIRLAFGALAPRPWRARTAEELIRGGPVSRDSWRRALDAEFAAAEPLPDNAFKIPLATNLGIAMLSGLADLDDGSTA